MDSSRASERPWLKAYPGHVDWAAPISEEPVIEVFDRVAARHGGRPCIEFLGKTYSYRRVSELVNRAAAGFQALGVGRGVRVGLLLPNTPYFVICYYAILKAGGTLVNFNPLYVAEEIARQIQDSQTRIMVTLDLRMLLPKASAALGTTGLKQVVVCPMADILPFPKNYLFAFVRRGEVARVPNDGRHLQFSELIDNPGTPTAVAAGSASTPAARRSACSTGGRPTPAGIRSIRSAADGCCGRCWGSAIRVAVPTTWPYGNCTTCGHSSCWRSATERWCSLSSG